MKMIQASLYLSATVVLSGPAAGQEMNHDMMEMMGGCMQGMQMMDANDDGKITKQEFMRAHEQMFTGMDADGDGSLGMQERKMGMEHGGGMDEESGRRE